MPYGILELALTMQLTVAALLIVSTRLRTIDQRTANGTAQQRKAARFAVASSVLAACKSLKLTILQQSRSS